VAGSSRRRRPPRTSRSASARRTLPASPGRRPGPVPDAPGATGRRTARRTRAVRTALPAGSATLLPDAGSTTPLRVVRPGTAASRARRSSPRAEDDGRRPCTSRPTSAGKALPDGLGHASGRRERSARGSWGPDRAERRPCAVGARARRRPRRPHDRRQERGFSGVRSCSAVEDAGRRSTHGGQGHSLYSGGLGSTARPKVDALTPARHAYQATAAVRRPR
jgi:hypothetical protein